MPLSNIRLQAHKVEFTPLSFNKTLKTDQDSNSTPGIEKRTKPAYSTFTTYQSEKLVEKIKSRP